MKRIILALFIASSFILVSCGTMTALSQLTSIAGEAGLVDENIAKSVSGAADSVSKATEQITPEQEYYLGRAVAATILTKYKLYNNRALTLYLNKICGTLAVNSERPSFYKGYHIAVLNSDEINAFATSGGHILVTRGLLECTESEDAVAAVLAHELSHIHLQHSVKAIKSSRGRDAILKTAQAGVMIAAEGDDQVAKLNEAFNESVSEVVSTLMNSGYSQQQEFEADKNALKLLSDAGYNPRAMEQMLELIKTNSSGDKKGFAKTHPKAEDRIKKLDRLYAKYEVQDTSKYRVSRFEKIF